MKKQYEIPEMMCEIVMDALPLCSSPVSGNGGGVDAGYGGVTTGNTHEPSAKERSYAEEVGALIEDLW